MYGAEGGRERTPLALPSSVTRGPGIVECQQRTAIEETPILRVNGLPGEGQVWLVSISGQSEPLAGGILSDALRADFARIRWQVGNTRQEIESDLAAAGVSVPLLCESVEVSIVRATSPIPAQPSIVRYAACVSAANGSPRNARVTRTIEVAAANIGQAQRIPPKATEVQITFDSFAVPATATVAIDFQDSAGAKVGASGFQNSSPGGLRMTLPRSAVRWIPSVPFGVASPIVAVFEINP